MSSTDSDRRDAPATGGSDVAAEERPEPGTPSPAAGDLLDLLKQERADFRNYKVRVARDRELETGKARAELVARLTPLLDELDRALANVPEEIASHPWVRGVVLARREIGAALRDIGVTPFGAPGDVFDPQVHEALFYDARPEAKEPQVTEVIQPGYTVDGRLVRPARVAVVGPPEPSSTSATTSPAEPEGA